METQQVSSAYIQTYRNHKFHVLAPAQDEIDIFDIAHSLSNQCRFTGHTRFHYSVGQHVVMASYLVPKQFAFKTLHHDDSEAYICDMSRPLKHFTRAGEAYLEVEEPIQDACYEKFGIETRGEMDPEVKKADTAMLYAEKEQLMPDAEWTIQWSTDKTPAPVTIHSWPHWYTEMRYLHRHWQLSEGDVPAFQKTVVWLFNKVMNVL